MSISESERARRWEALTPHRADLLRLARARTSSFDDAEDCVQEALARAVEFEGLDLERAGAFLATTTIRLTADLHRSRQRQARVALRVGGQGGSQADFVEDLADHALARWLRQQTLELSPQEQAVLSTRVDGGSSRDAAEALGISLRAAESSLTRARTKLQSAWAKVAVVVGALWLTARRHAVVSVPVTTVAAVVALGPVMLLPSVSPAPSQSAPLVRTPPAAVAPRAAVPVPAARPAAPAVTAGSPAVRHGAGTATVPTAPRPAPSRCSDRCPTSERGASVSVGATEVAVVTKQGVTTVSVALLPHAPDLQLRVSLVE